MGEPTFTEAGSTLSGAVLHSCDECEALVLTRGRRRHGLWHLQLERVMEAHSETLAVLTEQEPAASGPKEDDRG